ncbi:hypothetical protein E5E91_00725 [Deinococcus radiodurans R1 = ATCC 13939 = DSM 20539]|jgi:hypothetical protein|uniref:Uncharacterized protein n=1 Tax=Deinococcus radiodurans (strain ATCC 13939 / DSM 20539 / JCM 16871 / CCUG 27074 / LMG 4051 / NBRC 15346 / NCIMB 9279 / VKM B-1422 / R1) TaxID=243230 RepID=Q9RY12_DEIRA|nr:hypothetical protein DR_0140 [Deinococcus radiodurans R1 = ATCC 13939 = DSM 20539]QEM72111.1 hypothetical protein DXG80_10320 [Deinococcus radiodurans]UDK99344.1 hypothetical protein E5E91_00725 [Deinococcus radiodurans R1 = ATCC 13939 = DSM 20539]
MRPPRWRAAASGLTLALLGFSSAQAQTGSASYCTGTFATISGGTATGSGRVVWHNPFTGYSKTLTNGDTSDFSSYGFNGSALNNAAVDPDTGNIYWIDRGNDNASTSTRQNRYGIVWRYNPFTGSKTNLGYLNAGSVGDNFSSMLSQTAKTNSCPHQA